ncbi:unnamed protein product [Rotaria magnacalcarata]|uniref:RRM domain-containing protein n=1 Tax=Rotaria magnacalcarata TaxID=392030 RepID=A0A816LIA8_9BILA|nr:unnamed protein product [Rotaria magnacalcarata]CAF1282129.1 unnamed protein product [Rotaria magnacalcarata]CAF1933571.1 unnamed protein product [Rotaria magnacalcarata]CAF2042181.1 unnamed protein product [Rotaria magnacalcarata]CAF2159749.1 unnamed protein product [Rotaria magnacalcarata]
MSTIVSHSKVVQVCNVSTTCQRDQLKVLFNFFGRIDDVQLYPDSDTLTATINAKVGYIKFDRNDSVHAALNMTNTIFIDKPLIVTQVFENTIPDETDAMIYCAPLNPSITLLSGGPTWPSTVINRLIGQPQNPSYIETIDPELTDRNLPPYPPLPGTLDVTKVEEIRRTVYLSNIEKNVGLDVLHEFLSQIGEIRFIRAAYIDENAETRGAYVEFSEQPSIPKVLSINGFQFFGRPLLVNHATSCIIKPATVRGLRSDEEDMPFSRSRSRSVSVHKDSPAGEEVDVTRENGRRSSRSRHRSSSRSKSRKKSSKSARSPKRRSRSRKRSRSKSRDRKRRSRSRDHHRRKKDSRKRSRSRSRSHSKGRRRSESSRKEKKSRH